ncbi:hypothetical protein BDP27DRAFT_1331605 [Rhodocollybia butyracea]|uniref:Uncharacterized protein n=1 Tax=Rhodocollybia butyracea TaxID=206335 RepID=A0A9P5PM37_9AGAR|nr:hypothetical protein BDP27DRAFT_1331605 [Rhodocollybia butyracea]
MYNKPGLEKSYPANFILAYHSTVVMNFWNGKHLYCMWPNLTFKGLYVRNLEELTPKLVDALEKYQERGFLDKYDPHGLRAIYGATPHYIQDDLGEVRHEMHQLKVSDIPGPRWRMLAEV